MKTIPSGYTIVLSMIFLAGTGLAAERKNPDHPIYKQSLEELTDQVVLEVDAAVDGVKTWVDKLRPEDGSRGRFRWSIDAKHPPTYPSTAYILEGLEYIGIFDDLITDQDRRQGIAWVRSTRRKDGTYHDPRINLDLTNKAQWILGRYGIDESQEPPRPYAKPFPQLDEAEKKSVDWIKAQYRELNPWGAGSRVCRHMRWLLTWHKQGEISIDPLIESLQFLYSIQDPQTGLFDKKNSIQDRINGNMKMFGFTQNKLDLPIPYADRMIDTVLDERMLRADYGQHGADGCNELDNWMVIAEAARKTPRYRQEEIKKLAAYRILAILRHHQQADGGISSRSTSCQQLWNNIEMAPPKPQGDALGFATLTRTISVCIRILGIEDRTDWTGQRGWDSSDPPEPLEIQRKIASLVFPSIESSLGTDK